MKYSAFQHICYIIAAFILQARQCRQFDCSVTNGEQLLCAKIIVALWQILWHPAINKQISHNQRAAYSSHSLGSWQGFRRDEMQNIIFEPQTATVRFERDGHAIEAEAALPGGGAAEMAHWLVSQIDISEYENEFSSLGRHPFDPRLMMEIFIYANCIGKRSTREIEKMCKEGIGAIWLLGGASPPSHSTCSRHRSAMARCCGAERAAAQIAQLLAEAGEISFEAFFQDGIEPFAGRYTFA
jgi:transposase